MADFVMTEEQYNKLFDAINNARLEVAQVKGAVSTFSHNLAEEQSARVALGNRYDVHDLILRGDGIKQSGLSEQIGDLKSRLDMAQNEYKDKLVEAQKDYLARAEANAKNIANLRKTLWAVGASVAIPVIVDLVLRLIQIAYHTPTL